MVDLQKLYPEKEISERLMSFLECLKRLIEDKQKKNQWFDLREIALSAENNFEEKTKKLKILNESYPGWIFLPWKMKDKTNYVLKELDDEVYFFREKEKFVDISFSIQMKYMYEYVKFLNIVGRPITTQTVEKFWNVLEKNEKEDGKNEYKIQYIYLQLLRAFRELADWEKYDLCRAKIQNQLLKYEEKQFLYANDWWMKMYRFEDTNLIELLNKWDLAQGDLYWPMIKSSMYAVVGEIDKGVQILSEVLPRIRKQLVKNNKDEYLCSMEECVVSLLNFIRRVNWDTELEDCIQTGEIKWWEENDEYCFQLRKMDDRKSEIVVKTNFDLSITYTEHMVKNNAKIYYALDYLRFLEQTGQLFRIQLVTNIEGFQNVIRTLYLYYPHWCLMQMLIAQDDKELDTLFGRNKLSGMTQLEVNKYTQEYLEALVVVSKKVKPENAYWSKSVYDHSAQILPQIISRLCYKCSTDILDQILDQMLILCNSDVRDNFKGINKILEGVCVAYTEKEQGERIEKILKFPMKTNERRTYYDPVNYLKRPKEKYKISDNLYNNILIQIRQLIENGVGQEKEDALQRLIILAQAIYMKKDDEEYLYQCLEKREDYKYQKILYCINEERYKTKCNVILKNILQLIEEKGNNEGCLEHLTELYNDFIDILPHVQADSINYVQLFESMSKSIKVNIKQKMRGHTVFIEKQNEQSYKIAIDVLFLKIKEQKRMTSIKEIRAIEAYFKELQEYYSNSIIVQFIERVLIEKIENSFNKTEEMDLYTKMEERLWIYSEEDIRLMQIFYLESNRMKMDLKKIERFDSFSGIVYQMVVYRVINTEVINIMPALRLLYALVVNDLTTEKETKVLFVNFHKLMEDTTIEEDDFEKEARHKLNCRKEICAIAREFYKKGERNRNILEWKQITTNPDEFVEIRNIEFE